MVMGDLLYARSFHLDSNQSLLLVGLPFMLPSFSSSFFPSFHPLSGFGSNWRIRFTSSSLRLT